MWRRKLFLQIQRQFSIWGHLEGAIKSAEQAVLEITNLKNKPFRQLTFK